MFEEKVKKEQIIRKLDVLYDNILSCKLRLNNIVRNNKAQVYNLSLVIRLFIQLHNYHTEYLSTLNKFKDDLDIWKRLKDYDIKISIPLYYLYANLNRTTYFYTFRRNHSTELHLNDFLLLKYSLANSYNYYMLCYNFHQLFVLFKLYNININGDVWDKINWNESFNPKNFSRSKYFNYREFDDFSLPLLKNDEYDTFENISFEFGCDNEYNFYLILYYNNEDNQIYLSFLENDLKGTFCLVHNFYDRYTLMAMNNHYFKLMNIVDFEDSAEYNKLFHDPFYSFQFGKSINQLYKVYKLTKLKDKIFNLPYRLGLVKNKLYTKNLNPYDKKTILLKEYS